MKIPLAFAVVSFMAIAFARAASHEFQFARPDAQRVDLMGEFNHWKAQPMRKGADGTWTLAVSMSPGTYGYKFLVDGNEWVLDPSNPNRKTVDGVENSSITIEELAPSSGGTTPANVTPVAQQAAPPTFSPTPGEVSNFEVPLSQKRQAEAVRLHNPKITHAKVAIAVPTGFDPQKSWPLFIPINTESYSDIDAMGQYTETALAAGWVIMAADPFDEEKGEHGDWRTPVVEAALDYLAAVWPASRDWPIASGGHSGGAKNGSFLAADLARDHRRVIGIFMSGCNQDMASFAYRKSAPPNFLNAAIYMSGGKNDTVATRAMQERVEKSLRHTGFRKVQRQTFEGGHDVYQPQFSDALKWFVEAVNSAGATPTPGSDFDKFFKKNP
jgi:hypothetical protein